MSDRHRVVIVGGGFGGVFAARWLKRHDVDILLIDKTNHHLFQPLLYQVATAIISEGVIAPPLRWLFRKHENIKVALAEATSIDLDGRQVECVRSDGVSVSFAYDSLIVAAGAGSSYFGHDEFAPYAHTMKTVDDALNLRRRIFSAYELAELEEDPQKRAALMTFVVVGGGPTGVEVAGQLAELAHRALRKDFRSIDPADARVLLYNHGGEILATFGDRLSEKATKALTGKGVVVNANRSVVDVDAAGVCVEGPDGMERVAARTVVWAAGVEASPLSRQLGDATGADVDRSGRVSVQPDCTLPGRPEVFVIGDAMSLDGMPGVAEVAMQQGIYAARTIKRRVKGKKVLGPFKYRDLGSMATIGKAHAVVSVKGIRLSGRLGLFVWACAHLVFLTGFRNRIRAFASWVYSFGRSGRGERTMTMQSLPESDAYADAVRERQYDEA